jgi:hypothetical protein
MLIAMPLILPTASVGCYERVCTTLKLFSAGDVLHREGFTARFAM